MTVLISQCEEREREGERERQTERERDRDTQRDLTVLISQCEERERERETDTEPTMISRSHKENQEKSRATRGRERPRFWTAPPPTWPCTYFAALYTQPGQRPVMFVFLVLQTVHRHTAKSLLLRDSPQSGCILLGFVPRRRRVPSLIGPSPVPNKPESRLLISLRFLWT